MAITACRTCGTEPLGWCTKPPSSASPTTGGEIGHALVVLQPGGRLTESELVDYLGAELAKYKIPKRFTFRQEPLPRTTSGKVQKFVVREQVGLSETRA